MIPIALTIAGSDPSGGAGIQADLKTFHQFGVYGTSAITLLTVQNTLRVLRVEHVSADLVASQIEAVIEDLPPQAVKTGALGTMAIIRAVAKRRLPFPLIVDPVMISKHGSPLIDPDAREVLLNELMPQATLVTPNLAEAMALTGLEIYDTDGMREAAVRIAERGAKAVLVKGGHLEGAPVDILWDGQTFRAFEGYRHKTRHTHGTGCTYSAAIAAGIALGNSLTDAVGLAKQFIHRAIESNMGLGSGNGPVNHWAPIGPSL